MISAHAAVRDAQMSDIVSEWNIMQTWVMMQSQFSLTAELLVGDAEERQTQLVWLFD